MNKITWQCPSNIALVKYWGKKDVQIPCNASVSMTLSRSYTQVELTLLEKKSSDVEFEYFFNGERNEAFRERMLKYLKANETAFPVLKEYALSVNSYNSFPHSTGIASSASAFGALALALLSFGESVNEEFYREASRLARLGSGSACRSMYAPYALWGKLAEAEESGNEYAVTVEGVHSNFKDFGDAILIVDEEPKKVSSSAGHNLMKGHIYAPTRFKQANENCARMLKILSSGDYEEFITIVEQEALTLHAMMMTSKDYYLLMKPGTIHAIETLMSWRSQTAIPACFTLDAGPNVHVLYPRKYEAQVQTFINSELRGTLKNVIYDHTGIGPKNIIS